MLKILIFGPFLKPKRAFDPLWWPYEPLFPAEMAFILNNYEEGVILQWFYSNLECLNVSQYPKYIKKKIRKKSWKSKNQKIQIPLVKKWHGFPIFLFHIWKIQDISRFQDTRTSMWELHNHAIFYVKHCMFFVVSSMAKYVHLQITLVSRCVMKKKKFKKCMNS